MEKLRQFGVGLRPLNDPLFEKGNQICRMYTQKGIVDEDEEELCHQPIASFICPVGQCKVELDSLLNFEIHYNSCHCFICSQCKKQMISSHLLDLHLMETHDSFFQVQAERKPMYRCFVKDCTIINDCAETRKKHCIEVHQFPHDFRFHSCPLNRKKESSKLETKLCEHQMTSGSSHDSGKKKHQEKKTRDLQFGRRGHKSFDWHKGGQYSSSDKAQKKDQLNLQELMETLPVD